MMENDAAGFGYKKALSVAAPRAKRDKTIQNIGQAHCSMSGKEREEQLRDDER